MHINHYNSVIRNNNAYGDKCCLSLSVTESCDEIRCEDYQECIISPGGKPTCVCSTCKDEDQNSSFVFLGTENKIYE